MSFSFLIIFVVSFIKDGLACSFPGARSCTPAHTFGCEKTPLYLERALDLVNSFWLCLYLSCRMLPFWFIFIMFFGLMSNVNPVKIMGLLTKTCRRLNLNVTDTCC